MRLHLLFLLSAVHLTSAFFRGGQIFRIREEGLSAMEVLYAQTELLTTGFHINHTALIESLVQNESVGELVSIPKELLRALSFRAVSASYVKEEVHGEMIIAITGHVSENVKIRLIKDADSPTGWVFAKVLQQASFNRRKDYLAQYNLVKLIG